MKTNCGTLQAFSWWHQYYSVLKLGKHFILWKTLWSRGNQFILVEWSYWQTLCCQDCLVWHQSSSKRVLVGSLQEHGCHYVVHMEAICNIRFYLGGYSSWRLMGLEKSLHLLRKKNGKWRSNPLLTLQLENLMRISVWQTLTLPVPVHRRLNCFLSYQLDNGMATSQVRKVVCMYSR